MTPPKPRVLIFVVAYDAERHIESVLERLPEEIFLHPRYHLLVIDDSSRDASAGRAITWLACRGVGNATVLRNPENLGYGGNQKLGYRYAIDEGFDFVVLLHGDGQYDPALIPLFVERFETTGADVVLGTRMHSLRSAARGGMPFHKMIGNRALTWFQNQVTGRRLSEYHTGYRGYSTAFLSRVPFGINTNDFPFDTEILLQAFYAGAAVVEIPIPTRYGDEVSHVNVLKYSLGVVRATLRYRMHTFGMLCSLKYRLPPAGRRDRPWIPYPAQSCALRKVRRLAPRTLLDLGCGPGHVARECEQLGVRVTGLDREPPLAGNMSRFVEWDLGRGFPQLDPLEFDAILMLDLLGELADPEAFLLALRHAAGSRAPAGAAAPAIVITTPNVAFLGIRLNLLLGRFTYSERGILNIANKRLFTRKSLVTMLEECGYEILGVEGVGVPFAAVFGGRLGRVLGFAASLLARLWNSLFAFQLLVLCRPRPGVKQLLLHSETLLGETPADLEEARLGAGSADRLPHGERRFEGPPALETVGVGHVLAPAGGEEGDELGP